MTLLPALTLSTFWPAIARSANLPTMLAVIVGGVVTGLVVAIIMRRQGANVAPSLAMVVTSEILVVFQVITTIGQSANQPTNTQTYIAGHISFSLLSVLYGVFLGVGVWVADYRLTRAGTADPAGV